MRLFNNFHDKNQLLHTLKHNRQHGAKWRSQGRASWLSEDENHLDSPCLSVCSEISVLFSFSHFKSWTKCTLTLWHGESWAMPVESFPWRNSISVSLKHLRIEKTRFRCFVSKTWFFEFLKKLNNMLLFSSGTEPVKISFCNFIKLNRNLEIWTLRNTQERCNRPKTRRERPFWIRNDFSFFEFCWFPEDSVDSLLDLGSGSESFDFTWDFQEKVFTSNLPFSTTIDATMEFLGVLKSWRSNAFVFVKNNFSSFQKIPGWVLNYHACSEIYWTTMLLHGWG